MNTLLILTLLQFIIVSIIDDSGVIDSIKRLISRIITKGKIETINFDLKPFSCSYCMNFWCGMIYLILVNQFTIPYIAFVLFLSAIVTVTKEMINLVRDLFIKAINKIYDLLQ